MMRTDENTVRMRLPCRISEYVILLFHGKNGYANGPER